LYNFFNYFRGRHSMREVEAELHRNFTTNAVIFRGEVERQSDLPIIAKRMKLKNKLVRVETDGSSPEMLKKLIGRRVVDYIAIRIPAPLYQDSFERKGRHDFVSVRESVRIAESSQVGHEIVLEADGLSEGEVRDAASQITGTLVIHADRDASGLRELAQGLEGPAHVRVRNREGEWAIR
jgi:hypothetical protein